MPSYRSWDEGFQQRSTGLVDFGFDSAEPFLVDDAGSEQRCAVAGNRIARLRRGELFGFPVAGVGVGGGVPSDAGGPQLDEARRSGRLDVLHRLEATQVGALGIVGRDGP